MASHAEGDVVTQLADLSQSVDQLQNELSAVVHQMSESLHDFRQSLGRMIESESRIESQIGATRQLERRLTHVQELLQSSSLYPAPPSQAERGVELNRINESLRNLSQAGNQEEILHAFLTQSLGYVKRAILFVNKEMQFIPWNHVGFSNENIPSITAEDPNDPIVRAASQRKILYREQTPALGLSWSEESGNLPHAFVCIPLVFNQKVPLVFYGDSDQTISLDSLELLSQLAVLVLKNQYLTSLVQKHEGVATPSQQALYTPPAAAPTEDAAPEAGLEAPPELEPEAAAAPSAEAAVSYEAAPEVVEPAPEIWEATPEAPPAEPPGLLEVPETEAAAPEAEAPPLEQAPPEPEAIAAEPEAAVEPEPVAETEPMVEEPPAGQVDLLTFEPVQPALDMPPQEVQPQEEAAYEAPVTEEEAPPVDRVEQEATTEDTQTPPPPLEMPVYEPALEPAAPALPTEEEEKYHNEARRFARLLVSEIKLYNEEEVAHGRQSKDLYNRLKRDIDRSREMYDKRVNPVVAGKMDYFHEELVRVLAREEKELLGADYPGPQTQTDQDA
jgi:hypothetical protein